MSTHEGVSCDNCMKTNFSGIRYKCLVCYDYDLCDYCFPWNGTSSPHLVSHPMQSILTQADFALYYAGENISPDNPPSFVCPYCGKLGFTETLLHEHVVKDHANSTSEVVCPICAASPSGEPNLVSEDFASHLRHEHMNQRDFDESNLSRQIRRRGVRSRNHRTMHFSGGPLAASNNTTAAPVISSNQNTSASHRDMDPIAELLSQLSGVRRNAQILQQVVSSESNLNDIHSKLQFERQRAAEIRQQRSNPTSSNNNLHVVAIRGNQNSTSTPGRHRIINLRVIDSDDLIKAKNPKAIVGRAVVQGPVFVQASSHKAQDYDKPELMSDLFALAEKQLKGTDASNKQLERFPMKASAQSGNQPASQAASSSNKTTQNTNKKSNSPDDDSKRYLLHNMDEVLKQESSTDSASPVEKRLFVQELLLSMLSIQRPISKSSKSSAQSSDLTSFKSESNREESHKTHNDESIAPVNATTPTTTDSKLDYVECIVQKQDPSAFSSPATDLDQLLSTEDDQCSLGNDASSSFPLDLNGSQEDIRSAVPRR